MKFYFFHLMPYQDIDPDYLKTNKSSWINLPNSYYDPKKERNYITGIWTNWN